MLITIDGQRYEIILQTIISIIILVMTTAKPTFEISAKFTFRSLCITLAYHFGTIILQDVNIYSIANTTVFLLYSFSFITKLHFRSIQFIWITKIASGTIEIILNYENQRMQVYLSLISNIGLLAISILAKCLKVKKDNQLRDLIGELEQYKLLLDSFNEGVIIHHPIAQTLYANQAAKFRFNTNSLNSLNGILLSIQVQNQRLI